MRTDEEADDIYAWRWIVLSLHNAVQGFMVLSLRHGNGLLALSSRCFVAWMEAHESDGKYPKKELDTYLGLYKKVKSKETGAIGGNTPFVPKGSEGRSIRKLNALRKDFIHFTPKGWSLEVSGLPKIGIDCLRLIAFLGWETQNVFWHSQKCVQLAKTNHAKCLAQLEALNGEYREGRI
ncbi:MAG: hypothetical protein L0H63_07140 [Nitrococcus sp.]|nr:hypothetical protein [Nitrococcus sp.]